MTDEEQEPRGEETRPPDTDGTSPGPPLAREAAVTSFIRGMLEGVILLVPATLFLFFAKAYYKSYMDHSSWGSHIPLFILMAIGVFLVAYWILRIVRAYRRGQPFRSVGLVVAIPAFLVFFGLCTMALVGG